MVIKHGDIVDSKAFFRQSTYLCEKPLQTSTSSSQKFPKMKKSSSPQHGSLKRKLNTRDGFEGQVSDGQTVRANKTNNAGKKKKIDLTLEWLDENYTESDGVCLARCILYSHYRDFCEKNELEPACAATFGKTIRQKFPKVTTRRLGMRGHSKYHYYGIGIHETSIYYNSVYAGKGLTRYSPKLKSNDELCFSSKTKSNKVNTVETFLNDVPDISVFSSEIGNNAMLDQIGNFVTVYKSFCNQTLSAAQNHNIKLVSHNLVQCWSDVPFQHYPHLLHNNLAVDLATFCDVLLYEALIDSLLPLPCDLIEDRHLTEIGSTSKQWEEYLKSTPPSSTFPALGRKKAMAEQFSQYLMRHVSFIKLNRAVKSIFGSAITFLPMQSDLEKINLQNSIASQTLYSATNQEMKDSNINDEFLKELKGLLKKNASVEMIVEWLDNVVETKVIKPSKQNGRSLKKRANEFLLKWSFFGARITHNLNNTNASSFSSFHYLRMFLVEYVMLAIETQFNNEKRLEVRKVISRHAKSSKINHTGKQTYQATKTAISLCSVTNLRANYVTDESTSKNWEPYGYCCNDLVGSESASRVEFYYDPHSQSFFDQPQLLATPTHTEQSQSSVVAPPFLYSSTYERSTPSFHRSLQNIYTDMDARYLHGMPGTFPSAHYLRNYFLNRILSECKKRNDTVIYENGSSFTYLDGGTTSDGYPEPHYGDSCHSSIQRQRSSSDALKDNLFYNPSTADNKKYNIDMSVPSNFHTKSPLHEGGGIPHQEHTKLHENASNFSHTVLSPHFSLPGKALERSRKDHSDMNYSYHQEIEQNSFYDSQLGSGYKTFNNRPKFFEEGYSTAHVGNPITLHPYSSSHHQYEMQDRNIQRCEGAPFSWATQAETSCHKSEPQQLNDDPSHNHLLYQDNLPSISSVLSSEDSGDWYKTDRSKKERKKE